jgi:hypothetical protein
MADDGRVKNAAKRLWADARQGVVGGIAFAVAAAGSTLALQLLGEGDVPPWVLGAVILTVGLLASIAVGALLRRNDQLSGQLDEARQQRDQAQQTISELQRQTAGPTDADLPAAREARELVRRIRALRTNLDRTGYNQTTGAETANLTAIIRDLEALVGHHNSAVQEAHKHWISGTSEHYRDSAQVTLDQLEAVASEYREPGKSWTD